MDRRKGHLEDSLRLQQFYRSAEEEQQWVRECRPQAASTDYGKTMSQVEKLQKKHQVGEGGEGWGGLLTGVTGSNWVGVNVLVYTYCMYVCVSYAVVHVWELYHVH